MNFGFTPQEDMADHIQRQQTDMLHLAIVINTRGEYCGEDCPYNYGTECHLFTHYGQPTKLKDNKRDGFAYRCDECLKETK